MDIEKVLGIFKEILEEEKKYNIQGTLNALLKQLNSNNSNEIDMILIQIKEYSEESNINKFAFSKLQVLNKLKASSYFGFHLNQRIKNLFNTDMYKIKENVADFISSRNQFLSKIQRNSENLEKLEFKSYYDELKTSFELGLIIPPEQSDLDNIQNILKEWHLILKSLKELCDEDHSEPKIYSVSSSNIGIYILESGLIVTCLLSLSNRVLAIYEKILKIKKLKKELEQLGMGTNDKDFKEKMNKIVNVEKEKIVKEVIKKTSKVKKDREKELENALRQAINIIIRMHNKGIIIESTPPKIEEPEILKDEETEENKEEIKKRKKEYEMQIEQNNCIAQLTSSINTSFNKLTSSGDEILQISHFLDPPTDETEQGELKDKSQ